MDPLEQLAKIIDDSGLSRRQFARVVFGRDESTLQGWFTGGKPISGPSLRWIRSIDSVRVQGDRVIVVHRYYAPVHAPKRVPRNAVAPGKTPQ